MSLAIPTSLHDSLMARLDRLQPVKEVAQTAAVIGRAFDHATLAALTPLPELLVLVMVFARLIPLFLSAHQDYHHWLHAMPALAEDAGAKQPSTVPLASIALAGMAPVGLVRLPLPPDAGGRAPSLLNTASCVWGGS